MALSGAIVWEVRTTGSDSNGGGFKAGASGTDYSQQDSPQLTIDGATVSATVHTTTAQINVSGSSLSATHVGNTLQITGGTATAGFYEITAVDTGNNRYTLDRSAGTSGQTVQGRMGGCLTTITKAVGAMATTNIVYVKNGSYTLSNATLTPPAPGGNPASNSIIGYNSTRGDLDSVTDYSNFPTITKSAGTEPIFTLSNNGTRIRNIKLLGNSNATHGVTASAANTIVDNVYVTGCTTFGILLTSAGTCTTTRTRSTANSGSAGGFSLTGSCADGCRADANPGVGFTITSSSMVNCVADGNTSHGISVGSGNNLILMGLVSYNNGGDGIRLTNAANPGAILRNNVFVLNGGYGINYTGGGTSPVDVPNVDYNAYGSGSIANTSGTVANVPSGAHDVSLTVNPFVATASGNYAPNATPGGGLSLWGRGYPGAMAGGTTIGYRDIGIQHYDAYNNVAF